MLSQTNLVPNTVRTFMASVTMRHTMLTVRNFSEFVMTSLTFGVLSVGSGAIDLIMVSPFGASHVAAIGLGELIVSVLFAVLFGYSDLFSSKLARSEGADATRAGLPALLRVYALTVLTISVFFFGLACLVLPAMAAAYPDPGLVWPTSAYVIIRCSTVGIFMVYLTSIEALKICGLKSYALAPTLIGFVLNIAGNALFLHTPLLDRFWNIEAAVASSTIIAQLLAALIALLIYFWKLPLKREGDGVIRWRGLWREYPGFMVDGFSIGSRNLNDYISNIAPLLFIGAMGAETVAAAAVATKLATLFYRVPQGCFGASLVFYSYALERQASGATAGNKGEIWRLVAYSAAPTAVVALIFLILRRELASLFGTSVHIDLVAVLLSAYFVFLPAYFFEHFFGELLAAHHRDMILFRLSTGATVLILIPFSYYAVFYLKSAFLAIAGRGLGAVPLAFLYWRNLRPHLRYGEAA